MQQDCPRHSGEIFWEFGWLGSIPLRDSDSSSSLRLSTLRSSRVQRSSAESNMAPDLSIDNENVSLGSRLSFRRGREMLRSTVVVVRENRKKPRVTSLVWLTAPRITTTLPQTNHPVADDIGTTRPRM